MGTVFVAKVQSRHVCDQFICSILTYHFAFAIEMRRLIRNFDYQLRQAWLTSSTFTEIENGRLNKIGRRKQLFIIIMGSVMITKWALTSYLYLCNDKDRELGQYYLLDYMESIGLMGRMYNIVYFLEVMFVVGNTITVRKHEGKGKLFCLTDLAKFLERNARRAYFTRDGKGRNELQYFFKVTVFIARTFTIVTIFTISFMQISGVVLHCYKSSDISHNVVSVVMCIFILFWQQMAVKNLVAASVVIILVTNYLRYLIRKTNNLLSGVIKQTIVVEADIDEVIRLVGNMTQIVKRFNHTMQYFVQNLVVTACPSMAVVIYFFIADLEPKLKWFVFTSSSSYMILKITNELYVASLNVLIQETYVRLNSLYTRKIFYNREVSLATKMKVRREITGIFSYHHPLGLTIGISGGLLTTSLVCHLMSHTTSLTVLILNPIV